MTFTFDAALTTDLAKVRRALGDVAFPGWVPDETITGMLTSSGASPVMVAAMLADSLSAQYAIKVDRRIGSTNLSGSQASKAFADLAKRLRAGGGGDFAGGADGSGVPTLDGPEVGGISIAARDDLAADPDRVQPSFAIGQDDRDGDRPDETFETST